MRALQQFRQGLRPFQIAALGWLGMLGALPAWAQSISDFSPHGGVSGTVTITGAGFTGATAVSFGGTPAAGFTVDSDTQITATAPASFSTGPISVTAVGTATSLFHYVARGAAPTLAGPVGRSALPLGVLYNFSPLADNAFGQSGGVNYFFENMNLPGNTWVYFGTSGAVGISMDNNAPSGPEIMAYSAADSNFGAGLIVYRGTSQMNLAIPWGPGNQVCTRLVLQFQPYAPSTLVPVVDAASVGLPASLGGVAAIPPGYKFQLNLRMEAAYVSGGCASWQPALALYDAAPTYPGQLAYSNYTTAFYYENTAPALGSLADQIVSDGGATPSLALSVGDVETTADGVTLTATSTDTAFVPETNIVIAGTGAARTVTVTTVAGQPGPSTITVRGTDVAGAYAEETFVVAKNTAPTISAIADQLVQQGASTAALNFTIGDNETDPSALLLSAASTNETLIPNGNITLGGSGAARTVQAAPFGSQTGTTTITVTVTDALGLIASEDFVVTVNAKPVLNSNVAPSGNQGQSVPITSSNLAASDVESGPTEIRYTLNPDGNGTAGFHGAVRRAGVPLGNGDQFTQQDIADGLMTFLHDDSCNDFGEYNFDIDDGDGGYGRAPLSPYRATVGITLRNDPPTANPLSLSVGLGASANGQLVGNDGDCLSTDPIAYAHVVASGPSKGTITAFNTGTGAFTYAATPGQSGADSFQFEVSDGTNTVTGTVSITIENQQPTAQAASIQAVERTAYAGTLGATDPDLPAQPLTYAIASPPSKGTITALDANTGAFTYTPSANRIASDSFSFTASDGALTSTAATIDINIRPIVDYGDLAVADSDNTSGTQGRVLLVDPVSGDRFLLSADALLTGTSMQGIAFEADGNLIASSDSGNVYRVNTGTGATTLLAAVGGMALGVHVDVDGSILVANANGGVKRLHPGTGAVLATYTGATLAIATDVDVAADGRLIVSDAASAFGAGANKLLLINPADNTEVNTGASGMVLPLAVARLADGRVAVGDGLSEFGAAPQAILVVDPSDGSTDATISDALIDGTPGLAVDFQGQLFASSRMTNHVLRVGLAGPTVTSVATGAPLRKPWGLAVYGNRGADLQIAKDNHRVGLLDGETITYAVVVTNAGPDAVRGATLADTLPATLINGSWACQQAQSTATCPVPASGSGNLNALVDLGVGQWLRFDVTAEVDGTVGAFVTNTATLTAPTGVPELGAGNNSSSDSDAIMPIGLFSDGFETVPPRVLGVPGANEALKQ